MEIKKGSIRLNKYKSKECKKRTDAEINCKINLVNWCHILCNDKKLAKFPSIL